MTSFVNLLPFRLKVLFLDKLGEMNLLDAKKQWLDELVKFIEKRVSILESVLEGSQASSDKVDESSSYVCLALSNDKFCKSVDTVHANSNVAAAEKEIGSKSLNVQRGGTSEMCVLCSKPGHRLYYCYSFIAASVEERCKFASCWNVCFSCLRSFQENKARCPIRSSPRAANCKKDHHALLCSCKFEKSHCSETEQKTVGVPAKQVNLGVSCVSNGVGARLHVQLLEVVSNMKFMLCWTAEVRRHCYPR